MNISFNTREEELVRECIDYLLYNNTDSFLSDLKLLNPELDKTKAYVISKIINSLSPLFINYFMTNEDMDRENLIDYIIEHTSKLSKIY